MTMQWHCVEMHTLPYKCIHNSSQITENVCFEFCFRAPTFFFKLSQRCTGRHNTILLATTELQKWLSTKHWVFEISLIQRNVWIPNGSCSLPLNHETWRTVRHRVCSSLVACVRAPVSCVLTGGCRTPWGTRVTVTDTEAAPPLSVNGTSPPVHTGRHR